MKSEIVFFNIPHLSVGRGGEVWESQVIEYLNNTGAFKAKLITTDCCYKKHVAPSFDYKVIPLIKKLGLNMFDFNSIRKDIESADIVYYFYSFIGSQIPILTNIGSIRKIIFGHHAKNDWNMIQNIYYNILDRKIKNIGYHHVLTEHHYKILTGKGFKNVFLIPNFVDVREFKPLEKDPNLIVAPGATSKEKGYRYDREDRELNK